MLDCRRSTRLGETETPLLEDAHKFSHALGPRAKQWLHRNCARPTCGSWRFSGGGRSQLWLTVGARTLVVKTPGNIHWCELWGHHFGTKMWLHQTACRLQCWNAFSQTTNRVGTQPHPSVDGCLNSSWHHSHLQTHPLTWPCPTDTQDPSPPTGGQAPVPPIRKPAQACGTTSLTRGQTKGERTTILQPEKWRPQTQKVRQNEMAEKYVPDEGPR